MRSLPTSTANRRPVWSPSLMLPSSSGVKTRAAGSEGIDLLLFVKDGYACKLEGHSAAGEDMSSIDLAILPNLPITLRQRPLDDQTTNILASLRKTPFRRRRQ